MNPAAAPPLLLTMGDPAGIGAEIALQAWMARAQGIPPFLLVDDAQRLRAIAGCLGWTVPVQEIDEPLTATKVFADALPVLHRPFSPHPLPGQPDTATGTAVIAAIETAVALVRAGAGAAVVTNPIHKKTLYDAGFGFPGHTEFLAALADADVRPVMMLASPHLRVVPVTVHVGLRRAIESLRAADIVATGEIAARALQQDFGISRPRLAVAGLNPHAGEEGEMGDEEGAIVAPAVAALQARGIDARGPLPPDTLFSPRARDGYDAALCMYHDQALIPLKALDFDGGVNVTLGLPFVRTSPDHGTAFDLAGTGRASAASLIAALRLAQTLAHRRAAATLA